MKILLVDDTNEVRGTLITVLQQTGLVVDAVVDGPSAFSQLRPGEYDVVLLDLKLQPTVASDNFGEATYTGIQVGATLHARDPDVLIVMYSADIEHEREDKFTFYEECKRAGAHHIVSRRWLMSAAPDTIAGTLKEWSKNAAQQSTVNLKVTIHDDFVTKACVERLCGLDNLRGILKKLLPSLAKHDVRAIGGGYSGAIVLQVSSSGIGGVPHAINIVKLSKSLSALQEELSRRPFQGTNLAAQAVQPQGNAPIKMKDWFGISVPEVRQALTLEDFLLNRVLNNQNAAALRRLVSALLVLPAKEATKPDCSIDSVSLVLRYTFLAELQAVLKGITQYSRSQNRSALSDVELVQRFVLGLGDGQFIVNAKSCMHAFLHGDFHGRNVLLSSSRQWVLIDFGRSDLYPRLFDFAALEVDIILRVAGSKDGSDWTPRYVATLENAVMRSYPIEIRESKTSDCLMSLRNALHNAIRHELEGVTEQEYAEVLLFHIFRYLRFATIPLPKKLLGVKWAAGILTLLGRGK